MRQERYARNPGNFIERVADRHYARELGLCLTVFQGMDLAHSEALVGRLVKSPERMPLYYGDLETLIATLTEETYQLSHTGAARPRIGA